jgi:hypothetical protein
MASPQRSVPASTPAVVLPGALRATSARPAPSGSRGPQSVAPAVGRRDPVRPGGRRARTEGTSGARPVRGGCSVDAPAAPRSGARPARYEQAPAPLRLTRRGRRVISGLSIAIGLSIAVVTVGVELAKSDGGLELAGSSTVVVQPGDTLWSLAGEVAPDEDRRAVVDAIVDVNGLHDVDLLPGMVLELP